MISFLSSGLHKSSAVNVGIVYLLGALVVAGYYSHQHQLNEFDEDYEEERAELIVILVGAAVSVLASILLIVGAHFNRRNMIVPWLFYDIFVLAGGVINLMAKGLPNARDEQIITFITFGWIIFFWIVVFNFYQKLKQDEGTEQPISSSTIKTQKPKKSTKKVSTQ